MDLEDIEELNMEAAEDDEGFEVHDIVEYDMSDGGEPSPEESSEEEGEQFDITLTASHSYMGEALSCVGGRTVLEAGWSGALPARAHHAVLFPGETVPMLLSDPHDAAIIADILTKDKLFVLLCPDQTLSAVCGYGVVCEVVEAAEGGREEAQFKARAVYRCRLHDMPRRPPAIALYMRLQYLRVVVLGEVRGGHALRHTRLAALDPLRGTADQQHSPVCAAVRRLDAALSPWPSFVFDMFEVAALRRRLRQHFRALGTGLERLLPREPVALSFWVASNLTLGARDRLALLVLDNALLRLHMECNLLDKVVESVLCCATCGRVVARQAHALAMSVEGAHANYTNPAGFLHDVLTVSRARNLRAPAPPSTEYSWFPGYSWRAAMCARCDHHLGWRFDATTPRLTPKRFYGLCRNYVVSRDAAAQLPPDTPPL